MGEGYQGKNWGLGADSAPCIRWNIQCRVGVHVKCLSLETLEHGLIWKTRSLWLKDEIKWIT